MGIDKNIINPGLEYVTDADISNKAKQLYNVYTKMLQEVIEKDKIDNITMARAMTMSVIEKEKDNKEEEFHNSELGKVLLQLGIIKPWRKHLYEVYDLIATYMCITNTKSLSANNLKSISEDENIYDVYFRSDCEELAKIEYELDYYAFNKKNGTMQKLNGMQSEIKNRMLRRSFYEIDEMRNACNETELNKI